jgi:hypothetical protein
MLILRYLLLVLFTRLTSTVYEGLSHVKMYRQRCNTGIDTRVLSDTQGFFTRNWGGHGKDLILRGFPLSFPEERWFPIVGMYLMIREQATTAH